MKLDVTFKENNQSFNTSFGEVFNVSDGGYDRGYTDGQKSVQNPLEYATQTQFMFANATFPTDYELTLNVSPNLISMASAFYPSSGVKKVTIKGGNETTIVNFNSAFRNSENLEIVDMTEFKGKIGNANALFWFNTAIQHVLGELDFSECSSVSNAFNTPNLVTILPKANTIKISINFGSCQKLAILSLSAIVDGLADLTGQPSQTLKLHKIVHSLLTDEQLLQIFNKNWSVE